jgi:hypothetical protein
LDKIVDAYLQWRASRPEIGNLDEEINALELQSVPDSPAIKVETKIQSSSRLENGSSRNGARSSDFCYFAAYFLAVAGLLVSDLGRVRVIQNMLSRTPVGAAPKK